MVQGGFLRAPPLLSHIFAQHNVQPGTPWSQSDVSHGHIWGPASPRHPVTGLLRVHTVLSLQRCKVGAGGCSGVAGRGGNLGSVRACPPSLTLLVYALPGERRHLTAAKKQIILPATAVFTQKPLVYEEQLSQSTQRNSLQYFLKSFFFFTASRIKRLPTEIGRTRQLNRTTSCFSYSTSPLPSSQTRFTPSSHPRCSPHLVPRDLPTPDWCCHAVSVTDQQRTPSACKSMQLGKGRSPAGHLPQHGSPAQPEHLCICFSTSVWGKWETLPPPRPLQPPPLPRLLPLPTPLLPPANFTCISTCMAQVLAWSCYAYSIDAFPYFALHACRYGYGVNLELASLVSAGALKHLKIAVECTFIMQRPTAPSYLILNQNERSS